MSTFALNYHNIQSISHLYVLFFVNRPLWGNKKKNKFYFTKINEKCIIIYMRNNMKKCNNTRWLFYFFCLKRFNNCEWRDMYAFPDYFIYHFSFGANFWRHFHIEVFECHQEPANTYSPKIANSCVSVTGFFFSIENKKKNTTQM